MNQLSGRAARRKQANGLRLRGPGWTRKWRKGRTKRQREGADVPSTDA